MWVAVVWWTTLDHIEHVDLLTRQTNGRNDTGQELPCWANKRFPLHVLVVPWCFPNEHQRCSRVTRAKHHLCASLVQATLATVTHRGSELHEAYGRRSLHRGNLSG